MSKPRCLSYIRTGPSSLKDGRGINRTYCALDQGHPGIWHRADGFKWRVPKSRVNIVKSLPSR